MTQPAALYSEPMADYLARKELSGSSIATFIRSRRDYVRRVRRGLPVPATDEMNLGSLVHAHVVPGEQDETIGTRFAAGPRRHDLDESLFGTPEGAKLVKRNTKAGKEAWVEFLRSSKGKTIVLPELWDRVPRMVRALKHHEEASQLLWGGTDAANEQTCAFTEPETDRACRVRFDRLSIPDANIVELKTASELSGSRVAWSWYELGYHQKAALYLDAFYALTGRNGRFWYVFVESSDDPDPQVAVFPLETDSPAVVVGREEYQEAIRNIQRCESENDWREPYERGETGYPLPGPILSKAEFLGGQDEPITIGGVPLGGLS